MITKIKRETSQYPESFKRSVIEEYLRTACTKKFLLKKYDIKTKGGIQIWMRQLGYADIHQKPGYLAATTIPPLATKKDITGESASNQELEKRIKELERLLEDEQLRAEAYERIIDIAEKEFHIPIRKKHNTK
jgi:transposase